MRSNVLIQSKEHPNPHQTVSCPATKTPPDPMPSVQATVSYTLATPSKQTVSAAAVAQQTNRAEPADGMSSQLTIWREPVDHISAPQTDMAAPMDHMFAQETDTVATMDQTSTPLAPQLNRASPPSHKSNNLATQAPQSGELEPTAQKSDNFGPPAPQSGALAATTQKSDALVQQGPHCDATTPPANNKSDAPVPLAAMSVDHASDLAPTAHKSAGRNRRKTTKAQTRATEYPNKKVSKTGRRRSTRLKVARAEQSDDEEETQLQTILRRDKKSASIIAELKLGFSGDLDKVCPIDTSQARKFVRGQPYLTTKHLSKADSYCRKVHEYLVAEMRKTDAAGITIYHGTQFNLGTKHGDFTISFKEFYDLFNFDMLELFLIRFIVM